MCDSHLLKVAECDSLLLSTTETCYNVSVTESDSHLSGVTECDSLQAWQSVPAEFYGKSFTLWEVIFQFKVTNCQVSKPHDQNGGT